MPESPSETLRAAAKWLRTASSGFCAAEFFRDDLDRASKAGLLSDAGRRWATALGPAVAEPLASWLTWEARVYDEYGSVEATLEDALAFAQSLPIPKETADADLG
jgi:hypothetical protein